MLQRQTFLLWRGCGRGDTGEFFHQIVKLGHVVVDIFVAILRIEIGR